MSDDAREIEYLRRHAQRLLAIAEIHKGPASPQLHSIVREIQTRIEKLDDRRTK